MTTFYSNHYSPAVGETGHFTAQASPPAFVPAGIKHGRIRRSAALLTVPSGQDLGDNDVIRLLDLKNTDRVINVYISMDANWGATTTFNVGLYKKGLNNDGAVVDEDTFASAVDWSGAIARVDYFKESGSLDDWDRGKQLYELANISLGASTYSGDGELWTLAATTTQDISATAAAVEFLAEVYYTAGD